MYGNEKGTCNVSSNCTRLDYLLIQYFLEDHIKICPFSLPLINIFVYIGKYQVKDIYVYMDPLIHEFHELWNGLNMFDVSIPINDINFLFHMILKWTIHDAL